VRAALTKGGLNAATTSLAIEHAQRGIRVNAVEPGTIMTPMHPVEKYAQLATLHPVGRLGEISDIVDAILYLEGASFVTGEILHVDGGQSAAIDVTIQSDRQGGEPEGIPSPSKSEAEVADLVHQATLTEGPLSIACGGTLAVSPNGRKGAWAAVRSTQASDRNGKGFGCRPGASDRPCIGAGVGKPPMNEPAGRR
jgi:hypothetical protein